MLGWVQAREVVGSCREAGALSIINDRVDIALAVGADGVHVGQVTCTCSPLKASYAVPISDP